MNRAVTILTTVLLVSMPLSGSAQEQSAEAEKPTPEEQRKLSGAERKALEDEAYAAAAAEYNEQVEDELDKVECKNERVTGSRQKQRVCKTVREWDEEKAATQRMLRKRGRASSSPSEGGGLGDPR